MYVIIDEQVLLSDDGICNVADSGDDRHIHALVYRGLARGGLPSHIEMSMDYEIYIFIATIGTNSAIFRFTYVWIEVQTNE